VRRTAIASVLLAAGAIGFAAVPESWAGEALSPGEIRRLVPGTYQGIYKDRIPIQVQVSRDGSLRAHATGKFDEGRWSVERGRLCVMFKV